MKFLNFKKCLTLFNYCITTNFIKSRYYSRIMHKNPISNSKYLKDTQVQIPLRITPELIKTATYYIDNVDKNLGYQAHSKVRAAQRWIQAIENNEFVWLGISGAATPAGLGGLISDALANGLIDVVVSTGANVFHDEHFAYCLPIRHGSEVVDDNDLRRHDTTRIYTQFIHNKYTLKAQDLINQNLGRKIFRRLKQPFSTPELLYQLGLEINIDKLALDPKSSFLARAAEFGIPIFLDSSSNHSLAMDFSLLSLEGYNVDPSSSKDVLQASALSMYTQPQVNIFLGEAGPRNFTQTTAPTACEIFSIPFDGSSACIKFTTSDVRTGGLSGSTESEAVSWGKYLDTDASRDIEIWGEYTLTFPSVVAYVAGKVSKEPRRLINSLDIITQEFFEKIERHRLERESSQKDIMEKIKLITKKEKKLRDLQQNP